jgi:hypothetical protein
MEEDGEAKSAGGAARWPAPPAGSGSVLREDMFVVDLLDLDFVPLFDVGEDVEDLL